MDRTARATSYDEVPYPADPYPASHPGRLAVVALLAGLSPAPVERCRVLELGCARGGNLIPMAVGLPGGSFVGIDASAGQVAAARAVIESLGLGNVAIRQEDILRVGDEVGEFDYIICHGTYSWVPAAVQDRILAICARNLAPGGVACVSYNTYPGWRLRGLTRDLMSYHAARCDRPDDRARAARRVLEFMADSAPLFNRAYASLLAQELEQIRRRPDSYLLHDHLEAINEPVYFHEMVERAAAKGLRFLSEVQSGLVDVESIAPAMAAGLRGLAADDVEFEQLLDFLINRKFRASVFCHGGTGPSRPPSGEDLAGLGVSAIPSVTPPGGVAFRNERLLRGALDHLADVWPSSVPWRSLASLARGRIGPEPGGVGGRLDDQDLTSDLLRCYRLKVVEFQAHRWPFVAAAGDRPLASPLARYQAASGDTVTNLRHQTGRLDDFRRTVLRLLDGRHDRPAILRVLRQLEGEGRLPPPEPPAGSSGGPARSLGSILEDCLEQLARFALLMG